MQSIFDGQEKKSLRQSFSQLLENPSLLCTIIDAETKQYDAVSKGVALLCGLEVESMLSHTVEEIIARYGLHNKLNQQCAERVEYMRKFACAKKKTLQYKSMLIDVRGLMKIISVRYVPVIIRSRKVTLIIGYLNDCTTEYDLLSLFELYKYHYPDPSRAVQYFLKYFGLNQYFNERTTLKDLEILLLACLQEANQKISEHLNQSGYKTCQDLEKVTEKIGNYSLEDLFNAIIKANHGGLLLYDSYPLRSA